ncbi:hypothetical protein AMECASPLE_039695 [Ameca splendens]|uniref:Uncharacterized protein n=1 Tax=Ameca splendens TaxID=208324 RepID=A0ABV0ZTE6_9TELE
MQKEAPKRRQDTELKQGRYGRGAGDREKASSSTESRKKRIRTILGFSLVQLLNLYSHNSVEPSVPLALSSHDFMGFFLNKIDSIINKIIAILPQMITHPQQARQHWK